MDEEKLPLRLSLQSDRGAHRARWPGDADDRGDRYVVFVDHRDFERPAAEYESAAIDNDGRRSMNVLVYMIPAALGLGAMDLAAFIWALRSGQFEDPDGAAVRVLNDEDHPLTSRQDAR
jgi:cbb3-type cytochrome oxidase maturation protein